MVTQKASQPTVFKVQGTDFAPTFLSPLGRKLQSPFFNFFLSKFSKKAVFRTRPTNNFSIILLEKLPRKSKKGLCNFFHIGCMLTHAKTESCSLKTTGCEAFWKSPLFTVKKHVSQCCGKTGKILKIKKLHSLYFCPPNMPAKFQQCRYKIVEKVPRRGRIALRPVS